MARWVSKSRKVSKSSSRQLQTQKNNANVISKILLSTKTYESCKHLKSKIMRIKHALRVPHHLEQKKKLQTSNTKLESLPNIILAKYCHCKSASGDQVVRGTFKIISFVIYTFCPQIKAKIANNPFFNGNNLNCSRFLMPNKAIGFQLVYNIAIIRSLSLKIININVF